MANDLEIAPPAHPENLTLTYESGEVSLVWDNTSNNEDDFKITRRSFGSDQITVLGTVSADTTSFTDHPPDNGPWVYTVFAENQAGFSSVSAVGQPIGGPDITSHLQLIGPDILPEKCFAWVCRETARPSSSSGG